MAGQVKRVESEKKAQPIKDIMYMDNLIITLVEMEIPPNYYSINEYSEEAICIEMDDLARWNVYEGERGNKYNERKYFECKEACIDLLSRLSESEAERREIITKFRRKCIRRYLILEVLIVNLTRAISDMCKKNRITDIENDIIEDPVLQKKIIQRKQLLNYLKNNDIVRYENVMISIAGYKI